MNKHEINYILIIEKQQEMQTYKRDRFLGLYTPDTERKSTDVACTILGALIAIALFVAANVMWNQANFRKNFASYYGSASQSYCNQGQILLFQNPQNLQKYSCVKSCPSSFQNYNTLCIPVQDSKKSLYLDNPEIATMMFGSEFPKVLLYTSIIALGLGFLNLFIVNCMPRLSARAGFYFCLLLLLAVGILLLVLYDRFWRQVPGLKIVVAILCFFLVFFVLFMLCLFSNQIKIYGIFVEYAVTYLSTHVYTYLYIPIFLVAMLGLVSLFVWQHFCFASRMAWSKNLFNFNTGVWGVLNILEFIWGFRFLRDAFNYCVAGNAVDWYWKRGTGCYASFRRLVCKNWGSVVFGSFFNAFFEIPYLIFELLRCHPNTCCHSAGAFCENSFWICSKFFDLIRTDAYSYINITGHPFCFSSQRCMRICGSTDMFVGYQSPLSHYRLIIHIMLISAAFLMSWFIQRYRMEYYGIWNNVVVIVTALLIVTWFISIFADVAEAIQTSFLCEREIESNYDEMIGIDGLFKDDLHHHEKRMRKDGNF